MKRFLLGILVFCAVMPVFSQTITINEKDLEDIIRTHVSKAVNEAVDKAVAIVVKEYEIKIIDKDIEIVNITADKDLAIAKAVKFEQLYYLEKDRNKKILFKIIGVGVAGLVVGFGAGYLLSTTL